MVVPLRSQARLWHSLLHWAYSALFRAQRARFVRPSPSAGGVPALRTPFGRVLAPPAASRPSTAHFVCPALQPFGPPTASDRDGNAFLRFAPPCASLARCSVPAHFVCSALQPFGPSPFCKRLHPQFAIVDLHRSQARLQLSLLTGRTTRCFAHRARASCAPQKMPEMTYTPQFAMVVLLRLSACSTPLFIGLTTACFAHCARPSCAPSFLMKTPVLPILCQCSDLKEETHAIVHCRGSMQSLRTIAWRNPRAQQGQ